MLKEKVCLSFLALLIKLIKNIVYFPQKDKFYFFATYSNIFSTKELDLCHTPKIIIPISLQPDIVNLIDF